MYYHFVENSIIYNSINILEQGFIDKKYKSYKNDSIISLSKIIGNKLYISYIYNFRDQYIYSKYNNKLFDKETTCLLIILDINTYNIIEKRIYNKCCYLTIIDNDIYLILNDGVYIQKDNTSDLILIHELKPIHRYDNENYKSYELIKYFMFKNNNDIYLTIGHEVYDIININNKIFYEFDLNINYNNLLSFYVNNRLIVINNKDSKIAYEFVDFKLKNLILPKEFNGKYEKVLKASENLCILYTASEHKIFDFNIFEFINLDIHCSYSLYSTNYYYINENNYLYDNNLFITSKKRNIYDPQYGKSIILKSSISNKSWNILKDLLINRCGLFKNIDNNTNKFMNKHLENMDLYIEYIKTGCINITYTRIEDYNSLRCLKSIKLFDLCLYLQDSDIDNVAYFLVKNYDDKYIYECLSRLKNFKKQKNILIENYLHKVDFIKYNEFINKCNDYELIKYIVSYNPKFYKEYTKII